MHLQAISLTEATQRPASITNMLTPYRLGAALLTVITSVVVEWYIHIGFFKLLTVGQAELHVLDVESTLYPLTLVESAYTQNVERGLVETVSVVEVIGAEKQRQVVLLHETSSVSEKEVGVRLQMHYATVHKEMAVSFKEECRTEALVDILHLRVRKCEPYLLNLVRGKETVDKLNVGAQKCDVGQMAVKSFFRAFVHSSTLYVYTNEINIGEAAGQPNGVFPLSASQLKNYRVAVIEVQLPPPATHTKRLVLDGGIRKLKHVSKRGHFGKFLQFSFAHGCKVKQFPPHLKNSVSFCFMFGN